MNYALIEVTVIEHNAPLFVVVSTIAGAGILDYTDAIVEALSSTFGITSPQMRERITNLKLVSRTGCLVVSRNSAN